MKKNITIDIKSVSFPNQFVSDKEKEDKEFGLKIGNAIQNEWFNGGNPRYYDRLREFHKLRLYARGEQSIQKYKNELAIDGDLSHLNLDWTPIPIMPKFVDIVVNGMSDRMFKIKAYAQDAMSQEKRSAFQDNVEGQMVAKDTLSIIQKKTGVNPFMMDPDELPNSDEELSLYMQLNYKPAIEIAEEVAINTVFDENFYQDIRKRIDYDMVVLGIGIGKHQFLQGSGIQLDYVDPANVIYSYTEDPFFKDCFYWGEIKTVPVTELLKIDNSLTPEKLSEISKYGQSWYDHFNMKQYYDNSVFNRDTCTLLYFNYKSTKTIVYKKKKLENGSVKMIRKDEGFNPPQEMMDEGKFEKVEKVVDCWYDGIMVMGTSIILKWEVAENMVRPKSSSQHAIPNYAACAPRMYKGALESLGKRMIPFADQIQMTHLKLQQVNARIVPDGVFIDADGINEVDLGNGQAYTPNDALKLYFQTGSVVGRSSTQDGDFNNARIPVQQLTTATGSGKTQMLIMNYNHYLDMLRTVTGLNEARDASTPDPNALVGLQKLAALNSNTATRHVLEAGLYIYRRLAEAITYRVGDILKFADFKEDFANKIGKYNVSLLDDIKELYIYDFGIFIEVSPDEEEKAQLETNIQVALSKGNIDIEDAIDIREVKNLKLANQLIKLKRKKKLEREERIKMQEQAMVSQQNLQSQQMAGQVALAKIEADTNSKIKVKQAEAAFNIETLKAEVELKKELMEKEFNYNMQLATVESENILERENKKETEKAKRISQQSTEASRLIHQRKNNLPPQTFESNNDNLQDIDFSEFEPR